MSKKKSEISLGILEFLGYTIVALTIGIITIDALKVSINVPTFHLDGAFQTASGLFRLDSGQLPGRDFYPYLGIGPLLTIFPIYKIGGADLSATVFAAKFTTIFFGWLAVSVLWHLVFRPVNLLYSLAGGSVILFGADFVANHWSLTNLMAFAMEPGNSLRPLRAALPYLVAITFYCVIKNTNFRNYVIGGSLGIALLWSNDFAIPTFVLFLFFGFCYFYCFEETTWRRNAAIVTVMSLLTWFALLSVITAGHALDLLKYNFLDVGRDQWWYFGPYGLNTRIFEIGHFPRIFSNENYFPIAVVFAILLLAIKTKRIEYLLATTIGLTLFAGGSLASIGGHLGGYFGGFFFWGVATSITLFLKTLILVTGRSKWLAAFRPALLLIPALLVLTFIAGSGLLDYKKRLESVQADQNKFYVGEFGGFLDVAYRDYIDYARQHSQRVAVEDYWGLWSSLNSNFPPWPVDSVIHALGNVRETSRRSIKNVDLIITTRYSTSPVWQSWNLSQNFWFYDELISKWEPNFISPTTVVWKRSNKYREFETVECQLSADKQSITLKPGSLGFYRVSLSYSSLTGGEGRYLLMFKNNISYGADAGGFVSLQPGSHDASFPVLIQHEGDNEFYFMPVGEATVEISSCLAEKIMYENEDLLHKRTPEDFYLTDGNWVNGIARRWAGFFTHNTDNNRSAFKVGNSVIFQNGDKRMITRVSEYGSYLNVWVDGVILKSEDVGFPNKFQVAQ